MVTVLSFGSGGGFDLPYLNDLIIGIPGIANAEHFSLYVPVEIDPLGRR